jgi:NADH-quinone oxidoreductase E subunit
VSAPKETFEFTAENKALAEKIVAKYPKGRQASAVLPLLDLAQKQNAGWLSVPAIEAVASFLDMPYMRAYEVATFYTMFHLKPVGKHVVEICTTTPCWLRNSEEVERACRDVLGIDYGETTPDGLFTLHEVECLGACVNAPMISIDRQYYEDLDYDSTKRVLEAFKRGEKPKAGPQVERQTSSPIGGPTTLLKTSGGA